MPTCQPLLDGDTAVTHLPGDITVSTRRAARLPEDGGGHEHRTVALIPGAVVEVAVTRDDDAWQVPLIHLDLVTRLMAGVDPRTLGPVTDVEDVRVNDDGERGDLLVVTTRSLCWTWADELTRRERKAEQRSQEAARRDEQNKEARAIGARLDTLGVRGFLHPQDATATLSFADLRRLLILAEVGAAPIAADAPEPEPEMPAARPVADEPSDAEVLAMMEGPGTAALRQAIRDQVGHPESRGWDGAVDDARLELAVLLGPELGGCLRCTGETVDACERAIRAELEG